MESNKSKKKMKSKFPLNFEVIDENCFIDLSDTTLIVHIPTYKKKKSKNGR